MNISILAYVSSLQFSDAFPTQEGIEQNRGVYVNSYKTHAMATHHGGTGKPLEKDSLETDVTIHDEYQTDVNDFENVELNHHTRLRDLTNQIDYLQQKVEAMKTSLWTP